VTDESVILRFQDVGLSLYEARIYVGLLRHGAQNGNELSKTSGVPSSKVYSTVEKMIGQGIVHSIKNGSSTQFVCIEPDELISRLRKQYNDPIEYLEQALPPLATFEPAEPFLNVTGLAAIREAAGSIIDAAQEEIHLSLWSADIGSLRGSLESAVERGVTIFGMLYSQDDELPPGTWLRHSYEEIVENRIGGRMLTLVSDVREALIARVPRRGDPSAVRTRSPVLTLIVQEYLHHDLVLQRAQINIGFDEWDRWWQADPDLRTVILGSTLQRGRDDVVALG
jgi:HTH-type transcriptional regulator, sugar sensing transcriptional regulator